MSKTMRVTAVILAAGVGSRMQSGQTKQTMALFGKSVLFRAAEAFERAKTVSEIVIVTRKEEIEFAKNELCPKLSKVIKIIEGGSSRAESARIGVFASTGDFLAIHDAARCLITPEMVDRVVSAAIEHGAATASCDVTDTIKAVKGDYIRSTVPRSSLRAMQTPQVFRSEDYRKALTLPGATDPSLTDDNMLMEILGLPVYIVDLGRENIKLTTSEDLILAEAILRKRGEGRMTQRIGHGYDVHKIVEGRKMILGGVEIPCERGLFGHSDADVLLHAIMDAILGALGEGDIGRHFPDTSDEFLGISSLVLLSRVAKIARDKGAVIGNIDATLILQKPKVAPYIEEMRKNIADALGCEPSAVNVKATTEEHLGFTGSGEGAAAHAVCLLSIGQ